jgi:carbamoyltransferase
VARLLADDEIVARCSGREEWGARALGNRSIMCNPSKFNNIERLNAKIKCRDFWMPFTPSIRAEDLPAYIDNPKNIFAPYMAITFDTTQLARQHFAAAVHPRDYTMRPQEVHADWNPEYHAILSAFKQKTGIGGVLNTSFNLHGEPNVSTPEDAIRTVRNSGLDFVLIGRRLFQKK